MVPCTITNADIACLTLETAGKLHLNQKPAGDLRLNAIKVDEKRKAFQSFFLFSETATFFFKTATFLTV